MSIKTQIIGVERGALVHRIAQMMVGEGRLFGEKYMQELFFEHLKEPRWIQSFTIELKKVFIRHIEEEGNHEGQWKGGDFSSKKALISALRKKSKSRYGKIKLPSGTVPFFKGVIKEEIRGLSVRSFGASAKGIAFEVKYKPKAIHPYFSYPNPSKKTKSFSNTVHAIAHGEQIPPRDIIPRRARSLINPKRKAMLAVGAGGGKIMSKKDGIVLSHGFAAPGFNTRETSYYTPYFTLSDSESLEALTETVKKIFPRRF